MIKVKWTDRMRSKEVLTNIGEEKLMEGRRKRNHLDWSIGVLVRNFLQRRTIKKKVVGKRRPEKERLECLKTLETEVE